MPIYILCLGVLRTSAGLYIGVRSGMATESQPADYRPTRFSVRPSGLHPVDTTCGVVFERSKGA